MVCISCGTESGHWTICVTCVCCIPDCESVGLYHGRCFVHSTIYHNDKPLKPCSWTCKSCFSPSGRRNLTEFHWIRKRCFPKQKYKGSLVGKHGDVRGLFICDCLDEYLFYPCILLRPYFKHPK